MNMVNHFSEQKTVLTAFLFHTYLHQFYIQPLHCRYDKAINYFPES